MKITQLLTVWTLFSTLRIAQDVVVDYDRSVDLTQYKTFDMGETREDSHCAD